MDHDDTGTTAAHLRQVLSTAGNVETVDIPPTALRELLDRVAALEAERDALRMALRDVAEAASDLRRFWADTAPLSASGAEGIAQMARAVLAAARPTENL